MGEFYNPDKLYKGGSRNNSLINKKMIFRVLGVLLFIESAMFLLCAAISLSVSYTHLTLPTIYSV